MVYLVNIQILCFKKKNEDVYTKKEDSKLIFGVTRNIFFKFTIWTQHDNLHRDIYQSLRKDNAVVNGFRKRHYSFENILLK